MADETNRAEIVVGKRIAWYELDYKAFILPEEAYAEAQRLIAEVIRLQATALHIQLRYLVRLPAEIAACAGLRTLTLDGTPIADLSPLAACTGLRTLRLTRTEVVDLSPLAACTGLQTLTIDGTQVTDLGPLTACADLQTLIINATKVADLGPLAACAGLRRLSLDRTMVADLSPLAACTGLQTLSLDSTMVADLSPLAGCTGLQTLSLDRTMVADLGPLAACNGLQKLILDGTMVADLGPLAAKTSLSDAAMKNQYDGLSFEGTPAAVGKFKVIAGYGNPKRTVDAINLLRRERTPPLTAYNPPEPSFDEADDGPTVPAQGEAIRFGQNSAGQLDLLAGEELPENERASQAVKQAEMLEAAEELETFAGKSNGFTDLAPHVAKYRAALTRPLAELREGDIEILFSRGIRMQQAAIDLAAKIRQGDTEESDRRVSGPLEVLLSLHGPFLQGTTHGNALYDAADRDRRRREDDLALKEKELELHGAMAQISPQVMTAAAEELARETTEAMGLGEVPDRSFAFGRNAINNKNKGFAELIQRWIRTSFSTPQRAAKTIGKKSIGGVATAAAGSAFAVSAAGKAVIATGAAAIDTAFGTNGAAFQAAAFFVNHAEQFRQIATLGGPKFAWLGPFIDWLEKTFPTIANRN